jgi:hypothetical protein
MGRREDLCVGGVTISFCNECLGLLIFLSGTIVRETDRIYRVNIRRLHNKVGWVYSKRNRGEKPKIVKKTAPLMSRDAEILPNT